MSGKLQGPLSRNAGRKINTELLLRVRDHFIDHPETLNMWLWGNRPITYDKGGQITPGAQGCIATWALALHHGHVEMPPRSATAESTIGEEARQVLNLNEFQAAMLFVINNWPDEFALRYVRAQAAGNRAGCAFVTCELILSFCDCYGDLLGRNIREFGPIPITPPVANYAGELLRLSNMLSGGRLAPVVEGSPIGTTLLPAERIDDLPHRTSQLAAMQLQGRHARFGQAPRIEYVELAPIDEVID